MDPAGKRLCLCAVVWKQESAWHARYFCVLAVFSALECIWPAQQAFGALTIFCALPSGSWAAAFLERLTPLVPSLDGKRIIRLTGVMLEWDVMFQFQPQPPKAATPTSQPDAATGTSGLGPDALTLSSADSGYDQARVGVARHLPEQLKAKLLTLNSGSLAEVCWSQEVEGMREKKRRGQWDHLMQSGSSGGYVKSVGVQLGTKACCSTHICLLLHHAALFAVALLLPKWGG